MKELNDDEIRIIGAETEPLAPQPKRPRWIWAAVVAVVLLLLALMLWWCSRSVTQTPPENDVYFDSTTVVSPDQPTGTQTLQSTDTLVGVTLRDTVVNDIPIEVFTPHNLRPALHVGPLSETASDTVVMALQAADLRADNLEIVSAFVNDGELLARGTAKEGFCAILGGEITLGVDEATPYFERAIEEGGDFFRQFPLVKNHCVVDNRVKNKALRRALALMGGKVVVVATKTRESLHDFSQALVDMDVETAIYLVGSHMLIGWINVGDSIIVPEPEYRIDVASLPRQVNYIIWIK